MIGSKFGFAGQNQSYKLQILQLASINRRIENLANKLNSGSCN
jgi:hypothetical protein